MKNAQLWWQEQRWKRRADQLFRRYSLRQGYQVVFHPGIETADIDLEGKKVRVNPLFPTPHPRVRHRPERPRDGWLRAFLAHEAAHARYTNAAWPEGLLGQIVNALEDERIERRLAQEVRGAKELFDFLGDHFLLSGQWQGDVLEGVLAWRWQHDQTVQRWQTRDPRWPQVQEQVEAAWRAADTQEVIARARQIMHILELSEDVPEIRWPVPLDGVNGGLEGEGGAGRSGKEISEADDPLRDGLVPVHRADDPLRDGLVPVESAGIEEEDEAGEAAEICLEENPDEDLWARLVWEVEGAARSLAPVLRAEHPRARLLPTYTRGRFGYERWVAGQERVFRYRQQPAPRKAQHIGLVVDYSGSMEGQRIQAAKRLTVLLTRAAEIAGVRADLWVFSSVWEYLQEGRQAAVQASRLEAGGSTQLLEPLRDALRRRPDMLFVISDGHLQSNEVQAIQQLIRNHPQTEVLPILLEKTGETNYRAAFGRTMLVQNPQEMVQQVRSWILARNPKS